MKLYSAFSTIDNWPHGDVRYDGIDVNWFVVDRDRCPLLVPAVSYSKAIEAYERGNPYQESAVNELFAADEVERFETYLKEHHRTEVTFEEVALPLPSSTAGHTCMAVGGSDDFHMLSRAPEYNLPFKVWGYYRVPDHWLIEFNPDTRECNRLRIEPNGTQTRYELEHATCTEH